MKTTHQMTVRAACIFIAAASIIVIGVQPIFIGLLTERLALTLVQQSWVMSAEMCGSIVGTLLCLPMIRRLGARSIGLSTGLLLFLSNFFTASVLQFDHLMALRLVSGVCAGVLYSYAIYCLGRMSGPDRSYGILLFVQTALFAFSAVVMPMVAERWGFYWAIGFLTGWYALVCLACLCLPARQVDEVVPARTGGHLSGLTIIGVCSLAGMLLLQLSIYSLWGFVEGIGSDAGIAPVDIGWAISMGLLGGLPGAALPSLLGRRLGRVPMILAGSLIVLVSIFMLAYRIHDTVDLALAVFLMNLGWNLALSYYMSSVVTHDPQGRLTRLVGVVQVSAAAAAPTLLALFMQEDGRQSIFVLSAATIMLGGVLMLVMLALTRKHAGDSSLGTSS
ncbi:MFS transporter [Pseudomonas sp. Leaf127]|uniref:MFS transporter n=1 Tax=Pseudomonas TaxID=286 RepID=UPI0007034E7E|nr:MULTISPECIES: MFS transporter [Pseudomonas]KQQ64901.1 MFS transporter [Pseudomonas sp. Leaf127]